MTPIFGTPRNVSIPSNSFSNGKGSFSTQLPFPQGQRMLLTMSDGTGFGTGGSTAVLQVEASQGGVCNTTDPGVAFSFELNTALQQCRPYTFGNYSGAVQPITITGIIPGGTSFILNPPLGPTDFTWIDNAAAGSSVVFIMEDSQGRAGGSSDVTTVASSDDKSCLDNLSPSSTPGSPSPTSAPSPNTTSGAASTPTSSRSTSIGVIVGSIIGALLFLAVVLSLGLFYLKRRRPGWGFGGSGFKRKSRADVDLTYDPDYVSNVHPYPLPAHQGVSSSSLARNLHDNDPFLNSVSPSPHNQTPMYPQSLSYQQGSAQYHPPSDYHLPLQTPLTQNSHQSASQHASRPSYSTSFASTGEVGFPPVGSGSSRDSMSTNQRKAAMAGQSTYKPSRFIVHTDVEDDLLPLGEEEVVELPPQYSERRAPLGATNPSLT
ncbi:hypothetical protein BD779DRAFT_39725 [Infundibulicybe gibba]|nr:hypothetical protein BD779DRAFT_39725 [Infundibulicybe gibba]